MRIRSRLERNLITNRQTTETDEPLFLLTGAVLWPCSKFAILPRSATKIVQNWFLFCTVAYDQVSFQNSFKSDRISTKNAIVFWFNVFKMRSKFGFLNSFKFRVLKSASLGAPRALPGHSQSAPETFQILPKRPLDVQGAPGGSRERFPIKIRRKSDRNSIEIRSKFDRNWNDQNSIEIR